MLCVQWFRKAYPDVLAFHVPNGEKRDRRTAEKLQRMGVLPGVADWLIFTSAGMAAIELKSSSGKPSADQLRFSSLWPGFFAVVRTAEEFQTACAEMLGEPVATRQMIADDTMTEPAPKFPWEA